MTINCKNIVAEENRFRRRLTYYKMHKSDKVDGVETMLSSCMRKHGYKSTLDNSRASDYC